MEVTLLLRVDRFASNWLFSTLICETMSSSCLVVAAPSSGDAHPVPLLLRFVDLRAERGDLTVNVRTVTLDRRTLTHEHETLKIELDGIDASDLFPRPQAVPFLEPEVQNPAGCFSGNRHLRGLEGAAGSIFCVSAQPVSKRRAAMGLMNVFMVRLYILN